MGKYSQHHEEEILEALFNTIGYEGFFIEFGAMPNFKNSNIRLLQEKHGAKCLYFDIDPPADDAYIQRWKATRTSVKYFPREAEYACISIDIDSNDFYIFQAMEVRPKVVVIEYNKSIDDNTRGYVAPYREDYEWKGGTDYGANIYAMVELAYSKGYRLYKINEVNVFFVRDDIAEYFKLEISENMPPTEALENVSPLPRGPWRQHTWHNSTDLINKTQAEQ